MRPTDVPGLAELQGRKLAAVHRAHRLLQNAAAVPDVLPPGDAVRYAARLLTEHLRRPTPPRVWVRRQETADAEWLELPGVVSVRWEK